MSKPKVYQQVINFKMTSDFKTELNKVAENIGVNLSDLIRGSLYMFKTYYENNTFEKTPEEKNKFFQSWIKAARDYEKYFIAREFMADFEGDKANQSEREKKLKAIHKNYKKFNVEDK